MPWVKFLVMNTTLVSWLESPLASKNPISFQGKFCLRNKCRKPCNKVGFTQNLRDAEIWGSKAFLCSLVFGHFSSRSPWMSWCKLQPLSVGRDFLTSQEEASPNSKCSTRYCTNVKLCEYQQKVVTPQESIQGQKWWRQSHILFTNTAYWHCFSGGTGVFECVCSYNLDFCLALLNKIHHKPQVKICILAWDFKTH